MELIVTILEKVAAAFRVGPGRDLAIVTLAILILLGLLLTAWTFFQLKLMVAGLQARVESLERRFRRARKVAAANHDSNQRLLQRLLTAMGLPTEVS